MTALLKREPPSPDARLPHAPDQGATSLREGPLLHNEDLEYDDTEITIAQKVAMITDIVVDHLARRALAEHVFPRLSH